MKFKLEWEMEVDDSELLEIVNDYREQLDIDQFDSLEKVSEGTMIRAMHSIDFIEEEIRDYCNVEGLKVTLIK